MPFKPPQAEKCPACTKSVYANEEILAADGHWHKTCFKCKSCNKALDSTTVAAHEGKVYCKTCHGRQFGPKGFGFGGGAAGLSTDTAAGGKSDMKDTVAAAKIAGPKVEGGCPRCGKRVYDAEKKVGAGGDWHKSCFNCADCHKSLDSHTLSEKEGEIYCKNCYAKKFGPGGKI